MVSRNSACLLIIVLLSACAGVPPKSVDPLAGKIFISANAQPISQDALIDELATADVIYLGEKHDQPEQHRLQLLVIEALLAKGLQPAVGLEMLSVDETSTAMLYTQGSAHASTQKSAFTAEDWLRGELGWQGIDNSDWQSYGPILVKAREHKLTVFGADLPQTLRSRISKVGKQGLSMVEQGQIIDSHLVDDNYRHFMYERFKQAHCGWGMEDYFSRLYDNWLARNDTMAHGILQTLADGTHKPVILIVGAGHTELNMGVYERVQQQAPDLKQVNIGFRVLSAPPLPIDSYLQTTGFEGRDYGQDHEYLWMTSPHLPAAEDPCKAYLESRKTPTK